MFYSSGAIQPQVRGVRIPVELRTKGSVANPNAGVVLMMLRHSAQPDNKVREKSAVCARLLSKPLKGQSQNRSDGNYHNHLEEKKDITHTHSE